MSNSSDILDKILGAIDIEVDKIAKKAQDADTLEPKDSKALNDYCRSLTIASKEQRDQIKNSGIEKMSDEELYEQAQEAMKALRGDDS